jgi:3-oxoacyl-(acyl-carrier-protein) synthase
MKIYITGHSSINALNDSTVNCLPEEVSLPSGLRLSCLEPDYKKYITDAGTRRRMSRAVKMGVTAAMQCLSRTPLQPDAILTTTGLGCLGDTEKFLKTMIDTGEELLNPTPFIQSTFNTVGAQIAMLLKNRNYNMTYVHRGFSFENALLDASMQLNDKEATNVLVGAYEETTDISFQVLSRLGVWRNGRLSGEGSQFFMLSSQTESPCILRDVALVFNPEKGEIRKKVLDFLEKNQLKPDDIAVLISGETGDKNDREPYQIVEELLPESTIVQYKHLTGDYQTVSSFALWLAVEGIEKSNFPNYLIKKDRQRKINKILTYNHFQGKNHSFMLIERAE